MYAVDSSSLISFFAGDTGKDVDLILDAITHHHLLLPPATMVETLSARVKNPAIQTLLMSLPLMEIAEGYWLRASLLRGELHRKNHKARLGDTLIAQSCIDHQVPLITRDTDFKHYAKYGNLQLATTLS